MQAGPQGIFVISWAQTETEGLAAAPLCDVEPGVLWRWYGDALRIDGPQDVLVLEGAQEDRARRAGAARMVGRLLGRAVAPQLNPGDSGTILPDQSFTITDGLSAHVVTIVEMPEAQAWLVMFDGKMPEPGRDYWVVDCALDLRPEGARRAAPGVICFTPGTRIETPQGPRLVEHLRVGDMVSTRDDGAQPLQWIGSRRISGARLFAMPELRPVRIEAGWLAQGQPDGDLLVSPQHRVLIRGHAAQALFNTPEILVRACDLVGCRARVGQAAVRRVSGLRSLSYVHLMLERHQVLVANGIESESFHPASTALECVERDDRARLLNIRPELAGDLRAYGPYARRALTPAQAAILRHDLAA
ncbi:hemolysin-type calcium-binding protein [Thioclava sp. SK-1]|uniref:Hint domain-containing protein n=1 Tax=Thioclava sp. SK-1 TaxID=1889770 RepID=UPI0008262C65|nr:Hint domain-containing protein [Thioclava sp. SK-1]OCX66112.1 hemolysin-type calcium-binding protein [Thioclava sp. SK-1]